MYSLKFLDTMKQLWIINKLFQEGEYSQLAEQHCLSYTHL